MTVSASHPGNGGEVAAAGLLQALLDSHGVEASGFAIARECERPLSLVDVARSLSRRGLQARVVAVTSGDVAQMGTALIELPGQGLGLLRGGRGARCRLELPTGEVVSGATRVGARIGAQALELECSWPATGSALGRLLRVCGKEPRLREAFLLMGATLIASGGLGLLPPLLVSKIVDRAIPEGANQALYVSAAALAAVAGLGALISNAGNRAGQFLEKRTAAVTLGGLISHYLSLDLRELQRQTAGKALQVLKSVPGVVRGTVHVGLDSAIDSTLAAAYLFWLARLAPSVAGGLLLLHCVLAVLIVAASRTMARQQAEVQVLSAAQSDRLVELIDGLPALRGSGATAWAIGRWRQALSRSQVSELGLEFSAVGVGELTALAEGAGLGMSVIWAANAILLNERTLGDFFVIVALTSGASAALTRLIRSCSRVLATRVQLGFVDELLARTRSDEPVPYRSTRQDGAGVQYGVLVEGVWFRYGPDAPWVLRNYSAAIPPGKITTIRWPSGRGKSTLLRLIAGLYGPERGAVIINGLDAAATRQLVYYVPQNCPLLAGSIRENLELLSGASSERVHAAAAATGLQGMLAQWPMGFETLVLNGGASLSSGQRQLVILTAALASERPILLLDEATNHLDSILRGALPGRALLAGRTVINVSHFEGSIH